MTIRASRRVRLLNTYEPVTTLFRDLPAALARSGGQVEVVVSSAEYRAPRTGLDEWLRAHGVRIVRVPSGLRVADSRFRKLWALLTYALGAAAYTLCGPRTGLNVFLTQPPLFAAWGVCLRVLRGERFACLVMDLYPDVAVMSGQISSGRFLERMMRAVSRWTLRKADAVIVIGRCMIERLAADGVSRSRMHLITNWADEGAVVALPFEGNSYRRQLGLKDSFVVLYSGNMGMAHSFDEVLHAAELLSDRKDIHFVFIGDGARRGAIEASIKARRLANVTILPFQPRDRLADSMGLGNVHLITQRPGMEGVVVPSKAYSALAAGRPIVYVGDSSGEIARTVAESDVGEVIEPNQPHRLAEVIAAYANDPERARRQGQLASSLAREKFSASACVARYEAVIAGLICGDASGEERAS